MPLSLLQQIRAQYQPGLPSILQEITNLTPIPRTNDVKKGHDERVSTYFPKTAKQPFLTFSMGKNIKHTSKRVGVVLSGGQAPGGHNVIVGLYDALKKLHPDSRLFGFCNGPSGILKDKFIEITGNVLTPYRNQGGFDLIGSGRTKIETPEQFEAAETTVKALDLDGLVIIGGDDSNTNAALLAEYFLKKGCKTVVTGVPKTIDGDLKNEDIEISFGFDTACKVYSEIIGNILRDSLSAKKYYFFIKLMGRSASHIALECALQTHANLTLISEEIQDQRKTLQQISSEICDMICARAKLGKDYGVILIPEGIIEFIPEFKMLINELNTLLAKNKPHLEKITALNSNEDKFSYIASQLSSAAGSCFQEIPSDIRLQLLMDRDPHGNVQVSKIETERLFIESVEKELKQRTVSSEYQGKFSPQPHFCGYEGRSGLPSNFDAQYCYALGHVAALLVDASATGYICCIQNLSSPVEEWQVGARAITSMMTLEERHGQEKLVIRKALVDLKGKPFAAFKANREEWKLQDDYLSPGPIQFHGPKELTDAITLTLALENERRWGL